MQTTLKEGVVEYPGNDALVFILKQKMAEAQNEIQEKALTISKMSDEIENLLETSAMVNAKINLLENDLVEERQSSGRLKSELETMKYELTLSQKLVSKNKDEERTLRAQYDNLIVEMNSRPTFDVYNQLEEKCRDLEMLIVKLKEETKQEQETKQEEDKESSDAEILNKFESEIPSDETSVRFALLEEELVIMKEQYAKCSEEKMMLNKSLEKLQRDYRELTNRSHNIMFFYIAPLIFLVAYLLFSALFS